MNDDIKVIKIGNTGGSSQSRSVYSPEGISPTLMAGMDHCNTMPYILEEVKENMNEEANVERLGNLYGYTGGSYAYLVYSPNGIAPTLNAMTGGGRQPMIVEEEKKMKESYMCASRGRNIENPSDRTPGIELEQRIEISDEPDISNCLTSVSKDSMILEDETEVPIDAPKRKYRIRKLTPLETWRIQNFHDDEFYKAEAVTCNTKLYFQIGNSITVNVLTALFGRFFEGKEDVYKYEASKKRKDSNNEIDKVDIVGFMDNGTGKHQSNIVYNEQGLSPAITTVNGGGTQQIKVLIEENK